MNIAIKLLNEEIERLTIFLKSENDPEYMAQIQENIDILKDNITKLTHYFTPSESDSNFCTCGEYLTSLCHKRG